MLLRGSSWLLLKVLWAPKGAGGKARLLCARPGLQTLEEAKSVLQSSAPGPGPAFQGFGLSVRARPCSQNFSLVDLYHMMGLMPGSARRNTAFGQQAAGSDHIQPGTLPGVSAHCAVADGVGMVGLGGAVSSAQGRSLALHSGLTPWRLREPVGCWGSKPG